MSGNTQETLRSNTRVAKRASREEYPPEFWDALCRLLMALTGIGVRRREGR
jgi:hypothetical protein